MTSANQGYVSAFNLSETIDEVLTINNLGGGSISEDLAVFAGNTTSISRIVYKPGQPRFSTVDSPIATRFNFDLLSVYGNGDPISIEAGKTIQDMSYDRSTDVLTIVFDNVHGLGAPDVGAKITIVDSYFDGSGTTFFNEKVYRIASIPDTTSITIINTGYRDVYEGPSGPFDPNANLAIGQSTRYVYALTEAFDLPTPLSYNTDYFVSFSNGVQSFEITEFFRRGLLVESILLTQPVNDPLVFVRKNAVSRTNLLNLIVPDFQDRRGNFTSSDSIYSNSVLFRNFNDNFAYLESTLDSANFFRRKKYRRSVSNTFDENPIKLEGIMKTLDPDPLNSGTEEIFVETSPGIFIIDPDSSQDNIIKLRSFSDNTSPWEFDGVNTLEYSAQSLVSTSVTQAQALAGQTMSIGNMILAGPVNGDAISMDSLQNVVVETGSFTPSQRFTHKLPVLINGEEYNILLTNLI